MSERDFGRRRFLAATASGLASVIAGCGYRPGGGEFAWHVDVRTRPWANRSLPETWRTDGRSLFRIRNRGERMFRNEGNDAHVTAYHSTGEKAWSRSADRHYVGDPAVADGRVYLSLEDGGVTALEGDDGGDEYESDTDTDPRWTTEWDGPPLELHVDDGLLVGVHENGLVGFDGDDGGKRFALERERFGTAAVADVAFASDRVWVLSESDGDADAENGSGNGNGSTLYGLDRDGTVATTRSLPPSSSWIEGVGSTVLFRGGDEIRAVAGDGNRRFAVDLEGSVKGTPIAVADADRCYYDTADTLAAIDVSTGELAWRLEDSRFLETPIADADGLYGRNARSGRNGCGLAALRSDGDRWWDAPPLDDLGCAGDLFLVGDRLVVVTETDAYGFRKAPSDGLTVL